MQAKGETINKESTTTKHNHHFRMEAAEATLAFNSRKIFALDPSAVKTKCLATMLASKQTYAMHHQRETI